MTKVKLCGLRTVEDILCVNEVKADIAGVIFTERFKRHVDEDTARKMKATLSPDIPLTGVFVDEPVSRIERLVRDGVIDYAQLHGSEDNAFIKELRMRCSGIKGFKIIKAFQIKSVSDLDAAGLSLPQPLSIPTAITIERAIANHFLFISKFLPINEFWYFRRHYAVGSKWFLSFFAETHLV